MPQACWLLLAVHHQAGPRQTQTSNKWPDTGEKHKASSDNGILGFAFHDCWTLLLHSTTSRDSQQLPNYSSPRGKNPMPFFSNSFEHTSFRGLHRDTGWSICKRINTGRYPHSKIYFKNTSYPMGQVFGLVGKMPVKTSESDIKRLTAECSAPARVQLPTNGDPRKQWRWCMRLGFCHLRRRPALSPQCPGNGPAHRSSVFVSLYY